MNHLTRASSYTADDMLLWLPSESGALMQQIP